MLIQSIRVGAVMAVAAFVAASAQAGPTADAAIASCLAELNVPDEVCVCIGERAEEELSENEQAFFLAMIAGNQTAADSLRGGMTINEMTTVAMFMSMAPQECAGQ